MNIEKQKYNDLFQLLPVGASRGKKAIPLTRVRMLVGRSHTCDVVINHVEVTAIHAVLEIKDGKGRVYDMNSTNGSYVNGKSVVAEAFSIGDTLKFGSQEFEFQVYKKEEVVPPSLNMLDPEHSAAVIPPISSSSSDLPKAPEVFEKQSAVSIPKVIYPLSKDPKAEYSEYIFEDTDVVFPIFNYHPSKHAVEIIILHNDRIHSVDYLPARDGEYKLKGFKPTKSEVEFPYLGPKETVNFVEVKGSEIFVNPLPGYETYLIKDENVSKDANSSILLGYNDIARFSLDHIQIFVRSTEIPPEVERAPIFRRDTELRSLLFIVLFFISSFLGAAYYIDVDEEIEKEKVPERIATILFKKEFKINKKNDPIDNKKKPIKPVKKVTKKPKQKEKTQKVPKPPKKQVKKNTESKKKGDPKATKTGRVKKVTANKGPNKKSPKVSPTQAKSKSRSTPTQAKAASRKASNPKAKGPVETYKAVNFKSTLSNILSKGGSVSKVKKSSQSNAGAGRLSGISNPSESATLKKASVSSNVGNFSDAASGKLDRSKGVSDLVDKKSFFLAGVPSKTVHLSGMDPDLIRQILLEHIPQFRYCYQRVLDKAQAAFHGIVTLNFTIGASGHVTRANVVSKSKNMPGRVRSCVRNVLMGIKFPEPRGGSVAEVNQPINFYPNIQ